MENVILTAPRIELNEFESLFIEMTGKNCNLKCKHCFLEFNPYKKIKDFIPIDKIRQALVSLKKEKIEMIHLSGAEPMLHTDFNAILRLCLKRTNVVIHTNGMSINDKKARFLRKVEEENNVGNEIIFKISIDHYNERQNDDLRGRGSFRKSVHAIQSLIKYGFNPIVTIVNYWKEDESELIANFKEVFKKLEIEIEYLSFTILPYINKNESAQIGKCNEKNLKKLDCARGRALTNNGIYNCLLLVDDHRGRSGCSFDDYSRKTYLDTDFCTHCIKNEKGLFRVEINKS